MQRTDIFKIEPHDETCTSTTSEVSAAVRIVRRICGVVWSDINFDNTELTITYDDQWVNRPVITQVLKGFGFSSEIFPVACEQTNTAKRPKNQAAKKMQYHRKVHIQDTFNCPALFTDTIK
jgi:hypothetical protein